MSSKPDTSTEIGLRERLIEAGLAILREKGLQSLTLRACAARCDVSHAAPAHHFSGLPGLLSAIAARGFDELSASMSKAMENAQNGPHDRLTGLCEGYLDFAKTHPALFTLMFNSGAEFDFDGPLGAASGKAYGLLATTCAPFELGDGTEGLTETAVWSVIHGLASLQVGGIFRMPDKPVTRRRSAMSCPVSNCGSYETVIATSRRRHGLDNSALSKLWPCKRCRHWAIRRS